MRVFVRVCVFILKCPPPPPCIFCRINTSLLLPITLPFACLNTAGFIHIVPPTHPCEFHYQPIHTLFNKVNTGKVRLSQDGSCFLSLIWNQAGAFHCMLTVYISSRSLHVLSSRLHVHFSITLSVIQFVLVRVFHFTANIPERVEERIKLRDYCF